MGKYLELEDLDSYTRSFNLSNYLWNIVVTWSFFAQNTVGMQFVKAIDSVSANIAEGFGRYGKKDKVKFYYYSYGSLKESQDWCEKSKKRKLLTLEQYNHLKTELNLLPMELHQLILFTNTKLKH